MPPPGVQLRPFFQSAGRQPALVPGSSGAEDLAVLVPLTGPISAGRPPIPPQLVSLLEVSMQPATSAAGSGWRVSRARSEHWNQGVSVELEWPLLTSAQRDELLAFLRDQVGLDGPGGALRAITIDVDGADVPDSAVDLLIVDVPDGVDTLLERVAGTDGLYRFGPVRAVEVLV